MSRWERYGTRDNTFSNWHRYAFNSQEPMIDIDCDMYCPKCRKSLVLVETAIDVGQPNKVALVTATLGIDAGTHVFTVLYTPSGDGCRCEPNNQSPGCNHGISKLRVRRDNPNPMGHFVESTPDVFVRRIREIRAEHTADCEKQRG